MAVRAERASWPEAPLPDATEVFEAVRAELAAGPRIPRATYRVQLNAGFTFEAARGIAAYLADLGVSDLYASPFFRARPGSSHGYDLVDHNALSPEIGSREDLDRLCEGLASHGLGLLLDFVPNHMGIGTHNAWWMDVLENGPSSLYAPFFDIDWAPLKSELENKVLLPVLGGHYGRELEAGHLAVRFESGVFTLDCYGSLTLPINPRTYPGILEGTLPGLVDALGPEHDAVLELQSILTGLRHLPPRHETQRARVLERRREKEILKRRLAALTTESRPVAAAVEQAVSRINGERGKPRSFDALHALLEDQAYRLGFWRVAGEEINYRRFFDINDLAAIRMESPGVFAEAHRLLFDLLDEGKVTALRIDHPDGLWDPRRYFHELQRGHFLRRCRRHIAELRPSSPGERAAASFERLRPALAALWDAAAAGEPRSAMPLYVVGEKILTRGERLPGDWAVHGTSGYEFAVLVGGVFVDARSARRMTEIYTGFTGQSDDFESLVYQKKKLVLETALASELNVLAHALNRISERDRYSRDFTLGTITDALREVIACFPVYRTYVTEATSELGEHDRIAVARAIRLAKRRNAATDQSVYGFLRSILSLEVPDTMTEGAGALLREFVMKFQQLTGPVMAKGLEDTAFYVYNRLVSLNEVGGEPERYGRSVADLHHANAERQRTFPCSMCATSTHDTKRSEDVRARISVLSELPEEWAAALAAASVAAVRHKVDLDGRLAPDPNEEYLFYQTVLGTWPWSSVERFAADEAGRAAYAERLVQYMAKATKEAKVNTSWVTDDHDYDRAVERFVRGVLSPGASVVEHLLPLARRAAYHGRWGALSQALLKLTSPGVPDIYQGNELWDDSLVDPDNRRPIDYAIRARLLAELRARRGEGPELARELTRSAEDGRIKLFVTHVALEARRRWPELFGAAAEYVPLDPSGPAADHVIAFARRRGGAELVVIAPRLTAVLARGALEPPLGARWGDTRLALGPGARTDAFTGRAFSGGRLLLGEILADFPVALLVGAGG